MFFLKILLSVLITLIIWITVRRFCLYKKLSHLPKVGKNKPHENLLYDNYYQNSKNKKNNKLICQLGVFHKYLWSKSIDYELEMLDIKRTGKYKILIVSSYDSNLSLEKSLLKLNPEVEIITFCPNLLNASLLEDTKKKENLTNLTVAYGLPEDIEGHFLNSKYLFDRILVRECLGNVSHRDNFLQDMKKLLSTEGFMNIRTFTFTPIFESNTNVLPRKNKEYHQILEKQKLLIDYWNYNFSTTTGIINDCVNIFKKVEYGETKFLNLFYLYNIPEFRKSLQIFFRDMGFQIHNIQEWTAIQSLNILVVRVN